MENFLFLLVISCVLLRIIYIFYKFGNTDLLLFLLITIVLQSFDYVVINGHVELVYVTYAWSKFPDDNFLVGTPQVNPSAKYVNLAAI